MIVLLIHHPARRNHASTDGYRRLRDHWRRPALTGRRLWMGTIPPVVQYLTLRKQTKRPARPCVFVKVRNRDATMCRAAYPELLDA
ncbi:hypothetical protein BS17DRAFT_436686 [Gyrodon lividus]|nr:hypothetical protein BS17DRAFT_436686 [Gyrodon lividus]